ncbi:MAG: alanine racemase [Kiritimatiellia bacterium]
MQHRVILEVSLSTLCANYESIRTMVAPCAVMPVLKANAYGLGVEPIARALVAAGAPRIAVAEPYEALHLVKMGVPVQILSGILPDEIEPMLREGVVLPLVSLESARQISEAAVRLGVEAVVHVKLDTGMGRAGILWQEAPAIIRAAAALPNLRLEGIFTHFPLAYESGSAFTKLQISRVRAILDDVVTDGISFKYIHAANSDAINNAPEACQLPFNLVRSGINLHGAFDAAGSLRVPLCPVLTMKTRLAQIRTLPAGTPIGYGHTYRVRREMRVGTVCAGYADGLPLALSNRGCVLVHGRAVPILGRLSMDYLTVDLEDVPEAHVGDTVTLLGREGDVEIQVQDWANLKGTHAYDVICSIGTRVQRIYVA